MRVLLTGSTGFIGRKLVERLDGNEVHLLNLPVAGRLYDAERDSLIHLVDLQDRVRIRELVAEIRPQVVIHLAAHSAVAVSYKNPMAMMEVNTMATVNLAEACRASPGFEHMIVAGTTEEYGVSPLRPSTEESDCMPNSPYSVAKHSATLYLLYLKMAYDFPVTIMRATNTYGRTDDRHFFVEKAMSQMMEGRAVTLGDPRPIRDFMYVDDHVEGYVKAFENPDASIGEIFNLATGKYATMREHAETIARILDFRGRISWGSIEERPLDIQDHRIDSSKAKKVLGWEAKVSFEEGIAKTARLLEAIA